MQGRLVGKVMPELDFRAVPVLLLPSHRVFSIPELERMSPSPRASVRSFTLRCACLVSLVLAGGCRDQDHPAAVVIESHGAVLAEIRCTVEISRTTFSCNGSLGGGARANAVVIGGQNHYVRLSSSATSYDSGTDLFSSTVDVQNLLLAPIGTDDGTTPHASGVRVFFATEPTNGVTVDNADGTDTFTASGQAYFLYSGSGLGGDGILAPDETSAGKTWRFDMNGASSFTFTVYVWAEVPDGAATSEHFAQVSAGDYHSCGLTAAGKAYCWGSDLNGELGNGVGITGDQGVPSPVAAPPGVSFSFIGVGSSYTCALSGVGSAYCWGSDFNGRLGNGTAVTESQFTPSAVEMPAGVSFSALSVGPHHACGLSSTGEAYCWGLDSFGQLGNGAGVTDPQVAPSAVEMPTGVTFSAIFAQSYHSCALGSDATTYCWGLDSAGQLGNGAALTSNQPAPTAVDMPPGVSFTAIDMGSFHTCAIGSDAEAYCWGWDGSGQLGNGAALTADQPSPGVVITPPGVTFVAIAGGDEVSCALASGGSLYCWGDDYEGRLGNGPAVTADQPVPVPVSAPGVVFTSISTGHDHSCAASTRAAYCWGYNSDRDLGDGTGLSRDVPTVVAATR